MFKLFKTNAMHSSYVPWLTVVFVQQQEIPYVAEVMGARVGGRDNIYALFSLELTHGFWFRKGIKSFPAMVFNWHYAQGTCRP